MVIVFIRGGWGVGINGRWLGGNLRDLRVGFRVRRFFF